MFRYAIQNALSKAQITVPVLTTHSSHIKTNIPTIIFACASQPYRLSISICRLNVGNCFVWTRLRTNYNIKKCDQCDAPKVFCLSSLDVTCTRRSLGKSGIRGLYSSVRSANLRKLRWHSHEVWLWWGAIALKSFIDCAIFWLMYPSNPSMRNFDPCVHR